MSGLVSKGYLSRPVAEPPPTTELVKSLRGRRRQKEGQRAGKGLDLSTSWMAEARLTALMSMEKLSAHTPWGGAEPQDTSISLWPIPRLLPTDYNTAGRSRFLRRAQRMRGRSFTSMLWASSKMTTESRHSTVLSDLRERSSMR